MSRRTCEASADAPHGRTLEDVLRIGMQANVGLCGDPRELEAQANDETIQMLLQELIEKVYEPSDFQAGSEGISETRGVQLYRLRPSPNQLNYQVALKYVFREMGPEKRRSMWYRLVLNGRDTLLENGVYLGTSSAPLPTEEVLDPDNENLIVSYSVRFWKGLLR